MPTRPNLGRLVESQSYNASTSDIQESKMGGKLLGKLAVWVWGGPIPAGDGMDAVLLIDWFDSLALSNKPPD
jgi:hypothetical protein